MLLLFYLFYYKNNCNKNLKKWRLFENNSNSLLNNLKVFEYHSISIPQLLRAKKVLYHGLESWFPIFDPFQKRTVVFYFQNLIA